MGFFRKTVIAVVMFCIATVGLVRWSPAEAMTPDQAVAVNAYVEAVNAAKFWEFMYLFIQVQEYLKAQAILDVVIPYLESLPPPHSGPHTDAWWHGVAICEQGGRNDPYFGYFSFMDGSQGGKPWADQVRAGNELLARAGREVGPWAAACVAAGYRAAPW